MTAKGPVVVVGYDGSADARSAVTWAARTALALGARLRVVHAVGLLEHAGMGGRRHVDGDVALKIAVDAGLVPDEVEWRVVDGDPCGALLRMAEPPETAILLVVGSRERVLTPGRCWGAPAWSWPSTPRCP